MNIELEFTATRGIERATARPGEATGLRATTINGRTEMMPSDPIAVAKILKDRRAKLTPGQRARKRMAADQRKRAFRP